MRVLSIATIFNGHNSFNTAGQVKSAKFLKKGVSLELTRNGFGFPVEAFLKLNFTSSKEGVKVSLENISNHIDIADEEPFVQLIALILSDRSGVYFSPFRYLYNDNASTFYDGKNGAFVPEDLWQKYQFQPASCQKISATHYKIEVDCLIGKQGRIARMYFEVKDNTLNYGEVKRYAETSLIQYPPHY